MAKRDERQRKEDEAVQVPSLEKMWSDLASCGYAIKRTVDEEGNPLLRMVGPNDFYKFLWVVSGVKPDPRYFRKEIVELWKSLHPSPRGE